MVDTGSCVWVKVPGTNVTLQIREGQPAAIMGAFAADFNAHVEPLRDSDSACWTATNSVASSNHLSGTAMDLNWNGPDGKTFRLQISEERAYPPPKNKAVRDLLDFYEGMIFCGGFWSIRDWMHFQMGGNTYGSQNVEKVNDFIRRKIRADGFSTYKRTAAPPPPPPPTTSYGLPRGSRITYGSPGFPDWVYQLGAAFGLKASTYPGHQESNRAEAGFAPNPQGLNRGIDWAGPVDSMQRFADYLMSVKGSLEQVIWQNPNTGQRAGVAGGKDVTATGYYASDYGGHRDHVHTRQSAPIPLPGGAPPPSPPPPMSKQDQYALAVMAEGRRRGITARGIQIAFATVFVESNWKMYANSKVPESLKLPHDAVGSDHDSVGLFQQRTPMWGPPSVLMDPAKSAGLFYDRLVKMNYNDTARSPGSFAADIQRPAAQYRGRYDERFGDAVALYNRLAGTTPPTPGDDMALVPQEQWDRVYRELTQLHPSRSPLRHLDDTYRDTVAGFGLNADGHGHFERVKEMAALGHPHSLDLLREVASATENPQKYPDRQDDARLAQAILAEIYAKPAPAREMVGPEAVAMAPQVVYVDRPVAAPEPARAELAIADEATTGQVIGRAYDALEALRLADALPIESRAPLAALISVLSTKNGAQL
jgi:hypothetical protein